MAWKDDIPPSVKEKSTHSVAPCNEKAKKAGESSIPTACEWALQRGFQMKSESECSEEVALSALVTIAWPERGASAIKGIKAQLRNRLKNGMLNLLLQVSVNRPETESNEAKIIHQSKSSYPLRKKELPNG